MYSSTGPVARPVLAQRLQRRNVGQVVPVSAARLEQLLEAEITTLALQTPQPLTLHSLQELATHTDEGYLARLLSEELPVRFAQRVKMLEALPDWTSKPSIANVRQMYVTSFKELRLADPSAPDQFHRQIRNIKVRHSQTNLLVDGFRQYAEAGQMQVSAINDWLDRFFALRVSTNMLISHYLQIARGGVSSSGASTEMPRSTFDPDYNPYRSSMDRECSAVRIARHAANLVELMSRLRYGVAPKIIVSDASSQSFPFVPRYLLYIVSELLKNSVRATVETHGGSLELQPVGSWSTTMVTEDLPPIQILVCGDANVCTVRISDQGGGIPFDRLPHVWSYLYTTAAPLDVTMSRAAVDAPADLRRLMRQEAELEAGSIGGAEMQGVLFRSPLAGLGCGLPLSRLYARYLGGTVELQTLPQHGTDLFVYLPRLGNSNEAKS